VQFGSAVRYGALTRNGEGETVSGNAILLKGTNGREAIELIKTKMASVALPAGLKVVNYYDQSVVIDRTIGTVRRNLVEAALLVLAVLLVFLGDVRAALLVTLVIPISMLFGFVGMAVFGVSANLMSLGAIDFGMMVDGAVVMVENSVRRLGVDTQTARIEAIRQASKEVARPIVFAVGIIIAVYLPIYFLEGLERRMFRPMAITVTSALLGSLILSLTAVPAIHRHSAQGNGDQAASIAIRRLRASGYHPVLRSLPVKGDYSRRTAAALLFPISDQSLTNVHRQTTRPEQEPANA